MAPNFFLEVKSGKCTSDVANLQALHTGALGERGLMALRGWRREGLGLDNKAHTITGHTSMARSHFFHSCRKKKTNSNELEFYMNEINSDSITGYAEGFHRGVSMYRNLRDFADEQRLGSIAMTNEVAYRTEDAEEAEE
ncbi:hypothetical protein EPUL_006686 [Erysiphe pulchra]|uniref:Uncharacterized protein n=1 Tax=Erysiphe pulchra TaxID=225359 RepID=A0A2S4PLZ4_9PEZI|nr:hypothetical protein EPUL_006686 [Erysiphe pulchra]